MLKPKRIPICRPGLVLARHARARAANWLRIGPVYKRFDGAKATGDAASQSKKCSLLFGLFRYQPAGKRVRLFYIPVMTAKPVPAHAAAK